MKKMKNTHWILCLALALLSFSACEDDVDTGKTVVPDPKPYDGVFDQWLYRNYLLAYNIEFKYWMDDNETSPSFNLIPADETKAKQVAAALKYIWFETYDEVAGDVHFLRDNAPRLICLVGSPAIDPENRTLKMGSAEGGVKILLYNINELDVSNLEQMNDYYLRTMHHEFAHILHQKKSYPQDEFNAISAGLYAGAGWTNLVDNEAWRRGCVSAYGCMEPREDFVEVIAHYVSRDDNWWHYMTVVAGESGREKINKKLEIATTWLKDKWNIDIEELKAVVQRRGAELPGIIKEIDF